MVVENLIFNIRRQGDSGSGSMNRLTDSLKRLRKSSAGASGGLGKLVGSLKRVAMYRILRTIIKEISQTFEEGLKNVYAFSQSIGSCISQTMDSLSGLGLQMKNQLGAALGELLVTIQPILEAIIRVVTKVADAVTQLFAILGGRTTYHKATASTKQWTEAATGAAKAAKEWKNQLMGFDEINRLEAPADTSGGAANAPENIGNWELSPVTLDLSFLDKYKDATMEWLKNLDFGPIIKAWDILKQRVIEFAEIVDKALFWAYTNILLPLAKWIIEDAGPASVELLAGALNLLNATLEALAPVFQWLWENWIKPFAIWLGDEFVKLLENLTVIFDGLAEVLRGGVGFNEFWENLTNGQQILLIIITILGTLVLAIWAVNHPILALIALVAALAYAFDISLEDVVEFVRRTVEAIKEKITEFKEHWAAHVAKMNQKTEECRQKIENFKQKFRDAIQNIKEIIDGWRQKWDAHVAHMNQKTEECRQKIDNFKQRFAQIIEEIKNILTGWQNAVQNVTSAIGGFFSGLTGVVEGVVQVIIQKIENIINKCRAAAQWVRSLLNGGGDDSGSYDTGGGDTPGYATGGFPEDGLFFANHGELVGQFAGGRTAVANNEEIIAGISRGVYNAVSDAFANSGAGRSGGGVILNVNGREFARAIWDDQRVVANEHGMSLIANG